MNRRQKKKYWKNHIILIDRVTGKQHIVKMEDLKTLFEIAGFTREEIKEWILRGCEE